MPPDQEAGGLTTFNGYLYVSTRNNTIGGQIWRSSNGTDWVPVGPRGLGDNNNNRPDGLIVFQGQLYVFESNNAIGIEAWRSPDGTLWTQVNPDGFGDSSSTFTLWSNSLAVFGNRLHVGVYAPDGSGGKVWWYEGGQTYLPLVLRK